MKTDDVVCLAVYGTLAPGRVNHHQLDGLAGEWDGGTVRGHLRQEGWGAAMGYPGLVLDVDGPEIEVEVFRSADLVDHWERLDAFEGTAYRRVPVLVSTPDGQVEAWIYALASNA